LENSYAAQYEQRRVHDKVERILGPLAGSEMVKVKGGWRIAEGLDIDLGRALWLSRG
jgi:hypothetical protein